MGNLDVVETTGHLAAWRINDFANVRSGIVSKEFMIGKWYWQIEARQFETVRFTLKPKHVFSSTKRLPAPIASLITRVFCSRGPPKIFERESRDQEISYEKGFLIHISFAVHERTPITLSLEFLDLKMALAKDGESFSIWGEEYAGHNLLDGPMSRMLSQNLYTDIVINTTDGSIGAHRAVLAANSPVFDAMFSGNYKEKETSVVNISDMSIGACKAMLNFIYGKREKNNEFQAHRMELISAADKYDIAELKKACEASLCQDINPKNVFKSIKCASMYNLRDLKSTCLFYLVRMGMLFKLQEEYKTFLEDADRELIAEVFDAFVETRAHSELAAEFLKACVSAWKPT